MLRRLVLVLSCFCVACASQGAQSPKTPETGAVALVPVPINDADFADKAERVLASGETSPERLGTLVAVVRHQLGHATRLFGAGHADAGLAAVTTALYLVRDGELRPEMLEGVTRAIESAAAAVSRVGNEGQALALYSLLLDKLPAGPERAAARQHSDALAAWQAPTANEGVMQQVGAKQRSAVRRSLFEPTSGARRTAEEATIQWITKALSYSGEQGAPRDNSEREEAVEAYRAVRTGALTLAALHLRHGDAAQALASIERSEVAQVVSPSLMERLVAAAEENDPAAWGELYQVFESASRDAQTEAGLDEPLASAAAWGAAVQLFRADGKDLRAAIPLSGLLMEGGMAEVAVCIFKRRAPKPDVRELSWLLGFTLEAVARAESVGDIDGARRTFIHAERFLSLAAEPGVRDNVNPTRAHINYVMGSIEARAGELTRARTHLEAAVKEHPTPSALGLLASIDRQRGDAPAALKALDRVIGLSQRAGDRTSEAETLLQKTAIQLEMGNAAEAKKSLRNALQLALDARRLAQSGVDRATAERGLARVLEVYGDKDGARRAAERAYQAAPNDARQVAATLLDSARRALTMGDLPGAREVVQRGLDAELPEDDLIYLALWLQLLELRLGEQSDGTFEDALAEIESGSSWAARLKAWALGKISDPVLLGYAQTRVEQVEAKFYLAMKSFAASPAERAKQELRAVSSSEAIQLVEVEIARDLLASRSAAVGGVPDDVKLP